MRPEEMAIFVRSPAQLDGGEKAARAANLRFVRLSEEMSLTPDLIPLCTMHLAKGLEFRAVAVMACDDEVMPDAECIWLVGDTSEMEDVCDSERQILYVVCTRARDPLLISSATTP